jgi:hypothetical protein
MRGGQIISISIGPVPGSHHGATEIDVALSENSFLIFAGPWAEARHQWPTDNLEDLDDDGPTFNDYLTASFANSSHDVANYEHWLKEDEKWLPHHLRGQRSRGDREQEFSPELSEQWPAIREVALRLLVDEKSMTTEVIAEFLEPGEYYIGPSESL